MSPIPSDPWSPAADRELSPSPTAESGAPLSASPNWLAALADPGDPAVVEQFWETSTISPVIGDRQCVDGVDLVEVTFLARPDQADSEVMVHLNGLTDAHREDIEPALLQPIAASQLRQISYLLPAAGRYSYTLVTRPSIDRDVGATRPGWMSIHEDGRADPGNPIRLSRADRPASSVFVGPDAPRHPAATAFDRPTGPQDVCRELTIAHADGRTRGAVLFPGTRPDAPLLVLLDGETWRDWNIPAMVRARGGTAPTVVLMDSLNNDDRGSDLPNPERFAPIFEDLLTVLRADGAVELDPARTVIAGQSYGGLASAGLVVTRPDLASAAIVQSGSFWYEPDVEPARDKADPGSLTRSLAGQRLSSEPRLVIQAGTDEGNMAAQARRFRDAVRATGASVSYTEFPGGHDYAWWREELLTGMDLLGI